MTFQTPSTISRSRQYSVPKPWSACLALLAALSLSPSAQGQNSLVGTLPPEPAHLASAHPPDIHGFEKIGNTYQYTAPFLPMMTHTLDHRLGVSRKVFSKGGVPEVRFFLLKPEALRDANNEPIELAVSAPGAGHWIDTFDMFGDNLPGLEADADDFHSHPLPAPGVPRDFGFMHFSVCESSLGYANGRSPYVCDGNKDCYELDLMLGLTLQDTAANPNPSGAPEVQLFSTRIRVKVADPKTDQAEIESVEIIGDTVAGPRFAGQTADGISSFQTPIIAGPQNEVMFAHIGGKSVPQYTDEHGQLITSGRHAMVYSAHTGSTQCDVTGWGELRPITFAKLDPQVNHLGFAQHDFRTPSGHLVHPHEDLLGNYLWADRDADNLFFATLRRTLLDSERTPGLPLYEYTCWDGEDPCVSEERPAGFKGWMMAGLWTQGKMVLLDSKINSMDFGIRAGEQNHLSVKLYSDRSLRVGTGEEATKIQGGDEPPGWARTTVQLGSIQHFLNADRAMRPRTPRDVVWQVSSGAYTDEIAFDDMINHRMLIFSPMNALKEMDPHTVGGGIYFDGNQKKATQGAFPMRLQNAATGLTYQLPAYGEVNAAPGEGRIENVALGGIDARGFYLFPQSSINYDIPAQAFGNTDWLVSLFVDRRAGGNGDSRLITFPSGAHINLQSNTGLRLCGSNNTCQTLSLPKPLPTKGWSNLAVTLLASGAVEVYQDGFVFARLARPQGMVIASGDLQVGKGTGSATPGFEGWIDEFKVASGPFSLEEICNHARGTLVSIPHHYTGTQSAFAQSAAAFNNAQSQLFSVSGQQIVHQALYGSGAGLLADSDTYACHVDYQDFRGISLHQLGDPEIRSLRQRLLFPEGNLIFDQPRPVSTSNGFCLSCHKVGRPPVLGPEALTPDLLQRPAKDDPRRMPLQAPAELFGLIPAHLVSQDFPPADVHGPSLAIDQALHRGPLYRWSFDEGDGLSFTNLGPGNTTTGHGGEATATAAIDFAPGSDRGLTPPGLTRGHSLELEKDNRHLRVQEVAPNVEPSIAGNELTLATWLRLDNDGQPTAAADQCTSFSHKAKPCTIVAKSGPGAHDITWGLRIFINGTWTVQMHVTNAQGDIAHHSQSLGATFDPAKWHHLAAVYDQGTVEIFLDGASLQAPVTIHPFAVSDLREHTEEPITIGTKLWNGSPRFQFFGRLDEMHIYDRALVDWEVAKLYTETP